MINKKNKKGIGFGKLFLVLCLILFGLTLLLFSKAKRRADSAIGTDELDKISSKNFRFYFFDSMRLAISEFIKESATYSFIDSNNANCQLTSNRVIIFNEDCKPDIDFMKDQAMKKISENINNSLKQIEIETDVSCSFEDEVKILRCYSNEMNLSAVRNTDFFSYVIYNKFNLNQTMAFDRQLNLTEIEEIYFSAKNCRTVNCQLDLTGWDVKTIERDGNYLVFSLESKKEYPFNDKIEKISWKFATEI